MTDRFHFAFFSDFAPPAWWALSDRLNGGDWWNGEFHEQVAQRAEAAKFDFLFFSDVSGLTTSMGGTPEAALKHTTTIYQDPVPFIARLSGSTSEIGLVATASTSWNHPYQLARAFSTIDSLSNGRAGWNIVTSADLDSARNFGLDEMPPPEVRYDSADEFVDVAKKLWDAWEPDAIVRDEDTNTYADADKVHSIDHEGAFYKVKGPLNSVRSPQGRPLLVQAGASERGRDFAARNADVVFQSSELGPAAMKEFRDDIRRRAAAFGRNPDDVKVTWAAFVHVTPTTPDGTPPAPPTDAELGRALASWSAMTQTDLTKLPLDEPFPLDLEPKAYKGMFEELRETARRGVPLRDAVMEWYSGHGTGYHGTPAEIADQMEAVMAEVEGDGFLIVAAHLMSPAYLDGVFDGLVPELQRRGLMQTEYAPGTLRERIRGEMDE
ncbi:NtaA/DmoA family FMN-dependent monooxygenase [Microbacterium gorillae]|uniref:NtaA/DmoA family FMN-dependent monooxygenase n=1 Tax=Microbacterium gorillae TaxID=1231063 RepID=UPI0005911C77|nr:NtaA/DmoA family FMN-dependent monooxygenase [Microbacterium gorillae]